MGNYPLTQEPMVSRALAFWRRQFGVDNDTSAPAGPASLQKSWDAPVVASTFETLLASAADIYTKARLRAVSSPHSGDWLKAIPSSSLGLRLDNEGMRIAVGLRLGTNLCAPFICVCGKQVDARGAHGLSCVKSAGRQLRHTLVNNEVCRAFSRAGIPARKEPTGLVPASQLRPDGSTVIPWAQGRCLAWDVTCPDTLAVSHLDGSANLAGSAAEHAATLKTQKYNQLAATHCFVPIAIETLGTINADGLCLLNTLGGRCISATGDTRERMFLFQRLSMAVQRGNVACFAGSVHQESFFFEQKHSEREATDIANQLEVHVEQSTHTSLVAMSSTSTNSVSLSGGPEYRRIEQEYADHSNQMDVEKCAQKNFVTTMSASTDGVGLSGVLQCGRSEHELTGNFNQMDVERSVQQNLVHVTMLSSSCDGVGLPGVSEYRQIGGALVDFFNTTAAQRPPIDQRHDGKSVGSTSVDAEMTASNCWTNAIQCDRDMTDQHCLHSRLSSNT